jgi:hypothetical protein
MVDIGAMNMTPIVVLSIITGILALVAAANFFYFFNIPVGIIFTIITALAATITAWVIVDEAMDPD